MGEEQRVKPPADGGRRACCAAALWHPDLTDGSHPTERVFSRWAAALGTTRGKPNGSAMEAGGMR
ncbi:hypothetical protein PAN31117_00212 [Pandoraea anapnoica]|uniref:Uncharacterized protein n=1 Tax=Pandoraea anapnoica TaxID=2508301 RepID=A0A5E4ZHP3_9BURK|nr:hypothetical protein PAN31117_00212 [Pandoraea anapnoica]